MKTTSESLISILSKYIAVIKAQSLLEKYTEKIGTSPRELSSELIPRITLQIACGRHDFKSLSDDKFYRLLKDLVFLSNSNTPKISKKDILTKDGGEREIKSPMEDK